MSSLTAAAALVCADMRATDPRRDGLTDLQLLDLAVEDVEADAIDDALAAGEISSDTALAYQAVWEATHSDLVDAVAPTAVAS